MQRKVSIFRRHGSNDLGYKRVQDTGEIHYFMSHERSSLAITHCELIYAKKLLEAPTEGKFCADCKMIETMRVRYYEHEKGE